MPHTAYGKIAPIAAVQTSPEYYNNISQAELKCGENKAH